MYWLFLKKGNALGYGESPKTHQPTKKLTSYLADELCNKICGSYIWIWTMSRSCQETMRCHVYKIVINQWLVPTFYSNHNVPCRIWQDLSVLILVSMLAYFCFLEELLVCYWSRWHWQKLSDNFLLVLCKWS